MTPLNLFDEMGDSDQTRSWARTIAPDLGGSGNGTHTSESLVQSEWQFGRLDSKGRFPFQEGYIPPRGKER